MKKGKYIIRETIQKQDGTQVYAVNKKVGEMFGTPMYEEVFRGTLEECKKHLESLSE